MQNWYALQTKLHKELFVIDQLTKLGVEYYFPTIGSGKKLSSFFPGYLFIWVDLNEIGCDRFNYMRGSKGLVQFGYWPEVVPESVIVEVKASAAALTASQEQGIISGAKVVITNGVLAGHEGVFERYQSGNERVLVLLSMLSKAVSVERAAVVVT